jgi:8-oxo-dGTP pyrophosphatase MutT (NUDIX family)
MPTMQRDFERRLRLVLEDRAPALVRVPGERDAAVLIPFVGGEEPNLIFTVRSEDLPSHQGQISFPGGSTDNGETNVDAALREAHEELGIEPDLVRVLGALDSVPTFVSGFVIHPVVGWMDELPELTPNPGEVAEVLEVPVGELVEEVRVEPGFVHGGVTFPTEAWIWRDHIIWGATARVLRLLLSRLADAGLADRPGGSGQWPHKDRGAGPTVP